MHLRSQSRKTAPDVRVTKNGKTIALVEIKAKIGWMQPVFSGEIFKKDMARLKSKKSQYSPKSTVDAFKGQVRKHCRAHKVPKDAFFLLLPSLSNAHRTGSKEKLKDHEAHFVKSSGLPKENFVLLSENLEFHLGDNSVGRKEYKTTDRFERMVERVEKSG